MLGLIKLALDYKIVGSGLRNKLKRYGICMVYKRDTSIRLSCFGIRGSNKTRKTDLSDERGNLLESGIRDHEVDTFIKQYEDTAQARYPELPKNEAVIKYLEDLADINRAKNRINQKYEHPDIVHAKNNKRSGSEINALKDEYYKAFGKESVNRAIKIAENVASTLKVKKEVLVSVMAIGKDFVWKTNIPQFQLRIIVEQITGLPFKKFNLLNISKSDYLKLLDDIYKQVGDKPLHPKLRQRIGDYFDNLKTGKSAVGDDLFSRGGKFPGEHAEIRALNELLHKIDSNNTQPLSIFGKIFGVNKNIDKGLDMTRCFHCWNITDIVRILFVD